MYYHPPTGVKLITIQACQESGWYYLSGSRDLMYKFHFRVRSYFRVVLNYEDIEPVGIVSSRPVISLGL